MAVSALEQLEQLKKRLDALTTRRTQAQVKLEAARQQYAEAVKEAKDNYGTAELDELRAILVRQEEANNAALAEFTRGLDQFENFISRIEAALADPEVMAAMVSAMEPAVVAKPATPAPAVTATAAQPSFAEDDI